MNMKNVRTLIIAATAALLTTVSASAQVSPSWIRRNAISPDGKTIAFCYKGDIYTVPASGGEALQITSNSAYESDPIWVPDGSGIVFSSYREGSKDIFVTSPKGGTPKRLTTMPGNETPLAVSASGEVLFSWGYTAFIDPEFEGYPSSSQVYKTTLSGSAPAIVTPLQLMAISIGSGGQILYEDYKGYEDPLRKHHTSSVTRDIWLYTPANSSDAVTIDAKGKFTRLSTYIGEDRNPVFAADGNTFYYLSEQDGKTSNVYRRSLKKPGKSVQLTTFDKNPVRFLSVSNNGIIAFSYNGDLYTMKDGKKPEKVDIILYRDDSDREMYHLSVTSGATSMAVSPSGKEIAVVVRGEVFVTSVDYKTTRRITNTPSQERGVCFSKDGRSLYYAAERDGCWSIWCTSLVNKSDKLFTYATEFKEERISNEGETCFQMKVSPDGEWIAYLRNRTELVARNLKSGEEKSLHKGVNYSYSDGDQRFEWSPDSRFILCNWQADGGWNNSDIALIELETGEITNLTRSGYSDGGFRWALEGKAMTWESDKNGYRSHGSWGAETDVYIMFFDGKAFTDFSRSKEEEEIDKLLEPAPEKADSIAGERADSVSVKRFCPDLENRDFRIKRLTPHANRIGDYYLTGDGKKLYYTQLLEKSMDLCMLDIREGNVTVVKRGVSGGIIPSADGKFIYMGGRGSFLKINLSNNKIDNITYDGVFEFRPAAEREYIFEHAWKQVKEKFYVEDLHGADWDYYHENYARFLPHIDNYYDFQDLMSEMLGELNGSHTGARYRPGSSLNIGCLGFLADVQYSGEGVRIKEILPGGVISNASSEIGEGDIIVAIEGHAIASGEDWLPLLYNKAGKKIIIRIRHGDKERDYMVTPDYSDNTPLYRRWVRQREEMVEKLSGGRVGYVHIQGMNSASFRELYSKALGRYRACDALIVDTRHNGGGWLHDDLVTFLGGKEYCLFSPRGQYIGHEPFNKWTKPSCVLIGEDNYSDASGFPLAYRDLGIGKLIGAPIPGTMTAVWWETQINPAIVFGIPQVGNWDTKENRYIENNQIEPDILIYNDPVSVLTGRDLQLEAAVEEMLKQIQ